MRGHQGDYGYDGSFHLLSAKAQLVGVVAQFFALAVAARVSLARGNRLVAGLAGASAAGTIGDDGVLRLRDPLGQVPGVGSGARRPAPA